MCGTKCKGNQEVSHPFANFTFMTYEKIEALRKEYAGLKYAATSSEKGAQRRKFLDATPFLSVPRLQKVLFKGKDGNQLECQGLVADLQIETLRIISSRDIPIGSQVLVTIEIQEGAPITVTGKVNWSSEISYLAQINETVSYIQNIHFLQLPEDIKSYINKFLAYKKGLTESNIVDKVIDIAGPPPPGI